jgi:hypothetical protein
MQQGTGLKGAPARYSPSTFFYFPKYAFAYQRIAPGATASYASTQLDRRLAYNHIAWLSLI